VARVEVLTRVDADQIAELRERDEFFWLDLDGPTPDEVDALGAALGLHALAVADTRNFDQRPKLDDFEDHVLLVFWSIQPAGDDERTWRPLEHHLYISGSFVVTVRHASCSPLDDLRAELGSCDPEAEAHVVYRILRSFCDAFDAPLEEFEGRIDALEADVFTSVHRSDLKALYHLKQELHDLLRRMSAQKDIFPTAAAAILNLPGLTQSRREELSDVRDQLVEIAGELNSHHDDASTLISLYFNASGDRLNRHAYRLTILATFFVIATVITGFFGQNFKWLTDNIDTRQDFLLYGVGGLIVPISAFGLFIWTRRKDWL
jgi:magnesium transporter